jgi:hypothetical protein
MNLKDDLTFQYEDPWSYHVEIREYGSDKIIFATTGIQGWRNLQLFLEDWNKSQQSNLVDIWIGSYKQDTSPLKGKLNK